MTDWGTTPDAVVETITCPWCEAVERHQQKADTPKPGVKLYARDDAEQDE